SDTGLPSHAELGYLRSDGTSAVELILAHPTGLTELCEGTIDGPTITLRSISVVGSSTAKPVRAVERHLTVEGDRLHYVLRMSAVGLPMTHHLEAELVRQA
ncbi:MAG TPA: FABP family protein, partial [Microthrixaceae bacterium]|nr:FABP family protein [Microthrixaceae bacterium]